MKGSGSIRTTGIVSLELAIDLTTIDVDATRARELFVSGYGYTDSVSLLMEFARKFVAVNLAVVLNAAMLMMPPLLLLQLVSLTSRPSVLAQDHS